MFCGRETRCEFCTKTMRESRRELKPVVERLFADPSLVSRTLLDDLLRYKRLDGVSELLGELGTSHAYVTPSRRGDGHADRIPGERLAGRTDDRPHDRLPPLGLLRPEHQLRRLRHQRGQRFAHRDWSLSRQRLRPYEPASLP